MNYYIQYDSNGNIYPILSNTAPTGMSYLGPYPKYTASSDVVMACTFPNYYMVQNGAIVARSNIADLQLADTQVDKIAQIEAGYTAALNTKFPTTALGASVTFNYGPDDQAKFSKLAIGYTAGVITYPKNITDANGKLQQFTDAAQIKQLLADLDTFESGLETTLQTLIQDVKNAATVDAVNAITVQF